MPSKGKLKIYNESFHSEAYGGKERDKKQSAFFSGMAKTRMNFILQNFMNLGKTKSNSFLIHFLRISCEN